MLLVMEIVKRAKLLSSVFSYNKKVDVDLQLEIRPYSFTQVLGKKDIENLQSLVPNSCFWKTADDKIQENTTFNYTIFTPKGLRKTDSAIVLLHGLNERNWSKYLTWAEYLCKYTNKAVILFPIAFHMNRAPEYWCNPRELMPWVVKRKEHEIVTNSTFVNVALSYRLSETPLRFYIAGKESIYNLWQLFDEIKNGLHPLFREDTSINIFAYSIGALISEAFMLANPDHLLDNTKLCMFCGGSIFSEMDGNARDIMDNEAWGSVRNYFVNQFVFDSVSPVCKDDFLDKSFKAMIRPDYMTEQREAFFEKRRDDIKILTLKSDTVMPTTGAEHAVGKRNKSIVEELDFPYPYSHQVPFPTNTKIECEVSQAFKNVFNKSASFLF